MSPKDANGIGNSEDSDQIALSFSSLKTIIWV